MSRLTVNEIVSNAGPGTPVDFKSAPTVNGSPLTSVPGPAAITSGNVDGAVIGGTTPAAATFTTVNTTGNSTLGNAPADVATINSQINVSGSVGLSGQVLSSNGPGQYTTWKTVPDFQNTAIAPLNRANGTPLQEGDFWWKTDDNKLFLYDSTTSMWIAGGGGGNASEVTYTPTGAGAVPRTLQSKLDAIPLRSDFSTDPEYLAAVAAAEGINASIVKYNGKDIATKFAEFKSVKDLGLVGDGVTNDGPALVNAIQDHDAIYFPPGDYLLNSALSVVINSNKRILGLEGSRLYLANGTSLVIRPFETCRTNVIGDVPSGSNAIPLLDASTANVGDLIWITTNATIESFGYTKKQVRRIIAKVGNTVYTDTPADFDFFAAEFNLGTSSSCRIFSPFGIQVDGLDVKAETDDPKIRHLYQTHSFWKNARIEGSNKAWVDPEFQDVMNVGGCDGFVFDHVYLKNSRYLPNISSGSRKTVVRNFIAEKVRHIDANDWASDTLIEDGLGFETGSIIQSHPSIRTTFKRIIDHCDSTDTFGFAIRGVGEIVEDCYAFSSNGIGTNTQGFDMPTPEGIAFAQKYDVFIRRFRSPTAAISIRYSRRLTIESCEVPFLNINTTGGNLYIKVTDDCVFTSSLKANSNSNIDGSNISRLGRTRLVSDNGVVPLLAEPGFAYAATPTDITAISLTNPCVVTSPAHLLVENDVVRLTAILGTVQLNRDEYTARNVTPNTFELFTTDATPVPVDATMFTAYTSGGKATKQKRVSQLNIAKAPWVGCWPLRRYYSPKVYSELATNNTLTRTFPVKIYTEGSAIAFQSVLFSRIRIIAKASTGFTETFIDAQFVRNPQSTQYITKDTTNSRNLGGVSADIANTQLHFRTLQLLEGENGTYGPDYYWNFDVVVTLPSTASILWEVDVEVTEWNRFEI